MRRRVVWVQLLIGWLPVWGLFTTLIMAGHRSAAVPSALIALRMMIAAAALGILVQRLVERLPWPHPVRARFVLTHLVLAHVFAFVWLLLNSLIESAFRGTVLLAVGPSFIAFMVLGIWLYVMVAGVSYTASATERAARAEANAAKSQLAALRSQLNPHFLFNALHAVVQLIPREPRRAAQAAEQLAGLLRGTIEEDRDLVTLGEEWAFVERYLELEHLRFGDRLRVRTEMSEDARARLVPLFAVQTLVENAIRHGAAPREEPTDITVRAQTHDGRLRVTVTDTGDGAAVDSVVNTTGTGLARLRDRLAVLYGTEARLDVAAGSKGGFVATVEVPRLEGEP